MTPNLDRTGHLIGGYKILRPIGHGGMGEVWAAEHELLGRRAAIKLLRHDRSQHDDTVARFFNEARAAAAISDPGIVQVLDFGRHVDGCPYIIMELLEGEPLDLRVGHAGKIDVRVALRWVRQAASAIGAAHARHIIHRDLKLANIFLARDPEVEGGERAKVLDFGIAKLSRDRLGATTRTNASALFGTPMYMSPEQCRGAGQVDQRTDIYSLGCVLFTLVTGALPFEVAGVGEMIAKHMFEPPPRASYFDRSIPDEVDALILRCMAKDPRTRYDDGNELATAIDGLLGSKLRSGFLSELANVPRSLRPSSPGHATFLCGESSSPIARPTTRRRPGLAIAGITLAIGMVGGWMAMARRTNPITDAIATSSLPVPSAPNLAISKVPDPPSIVIADARTWLDHTLSQLRMWSANIATVSHSTDAKRPTPRFAPVRNHPTKTPVVPPLPLSPRPVAAEPAKIPLGSDGIPTSRS